jgi:hypothetical protein
VTISLRIALEPLIAGIDLSAVDDTNDAPEAAIYDQLRALGPEALEAALRDAWPRVSQGLLIFVDGERMMPEITDLQIPAAGDLDLPRDSILTVSRRPTARGRGRGDRCRARLGHLHPAPDRRWGGRLRRVSAGGELTPPLPRAEVLTEGAGAVFLRYIGAGFEHIVPLGLDHILFVLGLFFFATQPRPAPVAGDGLHGGPYGDAGSGGHGHRLDPRQHRGAADRGDDRLRGHREHHRARERAGAHGARFRLRPLHGLGFASVLGDYGIASDRFAFALIGFNIGVELGQLAVIGMAFALVGWFIHRSWYRKAIAIPVSLVIAAIGAYWVVERTLL